MARQRFRPSTHSFATSSRQSHSRYRRTSSLTATATTTTSSDGDGHVPSSTLVAGHKEHRDVYMSVYAAHESVGCAVYEFESGKLSLLEDAPFETSAAPVAVTTNDTSSSSSSMEVEKRWQNPSSDVVASIVDRFRPDVVLTSSSCSEVVLSRLKDELAKLHAVLQIRPSREFSREQGMAKIMALPCHTSGEEAESSTLSGAPHLALITMPLSVAAANALLAQLHRHAQLHQGERGERGSSLPVHSIEMIALADTMFVSADTRRALCIFDEEEHAVGHSTQSKEGLSLFSLFNCVQTHASRSFLRRWLLFPSLSIALLQDRFDAVELFVTQRTLRESLRTDIKGTKNIHRLTARLSDGNADLSVWSGIYDFASTCILIRGHCESLDEGQQQVAIVTTILATFHLERLQHIRQSVEEVIDWEESRLSHRLCVKAGLNAQLDEWREVYSNLPSILCSIVEKMKGRMGHLLDPAFDLYLEYFPQVGYLQALCRKDGSRVDARSISAGEAIGWAYQYASEVKAYFKTDETRQLDGQLGDLYSFIAGREIEIMQALYNDVVGYLNWLNSSSDVVAQLDCLLGFAVVAAKGGYCRPTVTEHPILDISAGRHPLQELIVETFVPNDVSLEGGRGVGVEEKEDRFNSVAIVTGANACGKSVYLKQSALIVYMAQVGSFVPAQKATVGVVDKLFTRMQAAESSSSMQSSFLADMQQVSLALQSATPRSLLLLDEMGKGTSSSDGASLFAATIKHLLERGAHCPRTLAATHFHEVFHDDFLSDWLPFTPAHMQVMLDRETAGVDGQITFLYKLRYGLELTSHAAQCERHCGIPPPLVERAAQIASLSREHNLGELALQIADEQSGQQSGLAPSHPSALPLALAERVARSFVEWDLAADMPSCLDRDSRLHHLLGSILARPEQ